jgi:hypothetical protein
MLKQRKGDDFMRYKITLTEEQMRITKKALEEFFRLRMGQDFDFSDDMACLNSEFPTEEPAFSKMIARRDHMRELMRAFFAIAFEPKGYLEQKTDEMLVAEDIWEAIRYARGEGRYESPLHVGPEPFPQVEKAGK